MTPIGTLTRLSLMVIIVISWAAALLAEEDIRHLPPAKVAIDEDILAALVDEPCHHFEMARDQFIVGRYRQAADHMRIASAYLRLESSRANAESRSVLDASVRDIQGAALAVERGQIRSVGTLQDLFAHAHYALAGHHCIKSAHRCCQPVTFRDKDEMSRVGHDLRAAANHLERGLQWAGENSNEEMLQTLRASDVVAENLIEHGAGSQGEVERAIRRLHRKLEAVTGRKLMLARPLTPDDDEHGPSVFR